MRIMDAQSSREDLKGCMEAQDPDCSKLPDILEVEEQYEFSNMPRCLQEERAQEHGSYNFHEMQLELKLIDSPDLVLPLKQQLK